jgi:threonyl-tRNA synthetase
MLSKIEKEMEKIVKENLELKDLNFQEKRLLS